MVALARRRVRVGAVAVGLLLSGISACSPFDPVKLKRHILLRRDLEPNPFMELGMTDAKWHAYDDQHSRNSPCTNAAAGGHEYLQCSTLVQPRFSWDGAGCPQPEKMTDGYLPEVEEVQPDGTPGVRLVGVISELLPCNSGTSPERCYNVDKDGDVSNMWGAGVGIRFSVDNNTWSPTNHGVLGVAFDLKTFSDDLPLRVELLIELDKNTPVPDRPLMRDDGSVLGTDKMVYRCRADPQKFDLGEDRTLKYARLDPESAAMVTSEQHPFGHPFWQSAPRPGEELTWDQPSPVKPGHNEFLWDAVKEPPEPDGNYVFDSKKFNLLGIEFHVFHPPRNKRSIVFDFSIENLAFIIED